MLIDKNSDAVRLTTSELQRVRSLAARNGFAVNNISNLTEALEAHIKALPPQAAADMLAFFDQCEQGKNA